VSNFVAWQTRQAATWQNAFPGRTPLASAQVEYSLLARRAEVEVLPALKAFGMGLFPWSPLARGVLTGQYRNGTPRGSRAASDHFAWFVEPYLENRSRGVVEAVVRAADGLDLTPLQVALLWVRDAPGVTAPLLGRGRRVSWRPPWRSRTSSCRRRSRSRWTTCPAGRTRAADRRWRPSKGTTPLDPAEASAAGRHPDNLAPDPHIPAAVPVAAEPLELPAAVLGLVGEQLPDRIAGKVAAQSHPLHLVGHPVEHREQA
jgi:hypothetical protein